MAGGIGWAEVHKAQGKAVDRKLETLVPSRQKVVGSDYWKHLEEMQMQGAAAFRLFRYDGPEFVEPEEAEG
jgi:hypothetical protein